MVFVGGTDDPQLDEVRNEPSIRFLTYGFSDPVYRLVVWCFIIGSACHLWLADAWQLEWLFADIVYLFGLSLLAWRGALLGWGLAAVGLAVPLLFHRDQLTQSAFLLLVALAGVLTVGREAWQRVYGETEAGDAERAAEPAVYAFLRSVQWLAIFVYAWAFLHKLNADFFDPGVSCAIYGLREITDYWNVPAVEIPVFVSLVPPLAIVTTEGLIAALHLLRVRRAAWMLAVAFHIFLTFTMAPAFVFVMLVGHAAFATREDLDLLGSVCARRWPFLVGFAAAVTTVSLWMHGEWPEPTMIPRELALWGLLAALVVTFPPWSRRAWQRRQVRQTSAMFVRAVPALFAAVFCINGLTPYLGVQFQHTAAMVSNLRIDRGCWNSLVFPETLRFRDEYIRVDEVYFGRPGRDPEYEKIVRRQLWSPPQFRQMRRNWCTPSNRPFYLRGAHRGETFEIDDLCAGEPLPFGEFRIFGVAVFGDFLRFQKNLQRDCPQTCIH